MMKKKSVQVFVISKKADKKDSSTSDPIHKKATGVPDSRKGRR
jgi:hypothetical protein